MKISEAKLISTIESFIQLFILYKINKIKKAINDSSLLKLCYDVLPQVVKVPVPYGIYDRYHGQSSSSSIRQSIRDTAPDTSDTPANRANSLAPMGIRLLLLFTACLAVVTQLAHGAFTMSEVSALKLKAWKEAASEGGVLSSVSTHSRNSTLNNPQTCSGGSVTVEGEVFPCDSVNFLSFLGLRDLEITSAAFPLGSTQASDIWGWLSPIGREITIECLDNGVVLIDSTEPVAPIILAKIETGKRQAAWCDVKVFQDVLYIVKDQSGGDLGVQTTYGVEVFNLTRIVGFESRLDLPVDLTPDFVYAEHGRSHNLAINPDSGFLYSVGTATCNGGLHMMNLNNNPLVPEFAGCVSGDGYTHDAQCVIYDGPDAAYTGKEICFAFNEDTLTIWDVSVKTSPVMLSRTCYDEATYTHQGWVTDDFRFVILDDELDELCSVGCFGGRTSRTRTTTYYFNITSLENPIASGLFTHEDASIDHNL